MSAPYPLDVAVEALFQGALEVAETFANRCFTPETDSSKWL